MEQQVKQPNTQKPKSIWIFVISIIIIALMINGGIYWWREFQGQINNLQTQISSLEQDKTALEEEKNQLESDVNALEDTNQELLNQIDEINEDLFGAEEEKTSLQKQIEELKDKSSSICTKDNSCKFRTPGSGFRCDADGKYNGSGDYWCECTIDCEVNIR